MATLKRRYFSDRGTTLVVSVLNKGEKLAEIAQQEQVQKGVQASDSWLCC